MADVGQTDHGIVAVHVGGEDPGGPDVEACEGKQSISQRAGAGQSRPGDGLPVAGRLGAVALQGMVAAVEAQGNAGGDVGGEREGHEQGLGEGGLVVGAGEEEVAVAFGDGAGEQRYDGRVCDVERGEDGEGIRRVALHAGHCTSVGLLSAAAGAGVGAGAAGEKTYGSRQARGCPGRAWLRVPAAWVRSSPHRPPRRLLV